MVAREKEAAGVASLIGPDTLRRMYATMLKCRMAAERVQRLVEQNRIGADGADVSGWEAIEVGAAFGLRPEDTIIVATQAAVTAKLIAGVPLDRILAGLFDNASAGERSALAQRPRDTCDVLASRAAPAVRFGMAAGVALAHALRKDGGVVVAFSGHGSRSLGPLHEPLEFASAHRLPVVFVVRTPSRRTAPSVWLEAQEDLSAQAQTCGLPGMVVDGSDAVAVHRVAQESIERARNGGGPTLIECKGPDRAVPAGGDGASRRRGSKGGLSATSDPLTAMEGYLAERGLLAKEFRQRTVDAFARELDAAVERAERSSPPDPLACLDGAYSFDIRDRELHRERLSPKL